MYRFSNTVIGFLNLFTLLASIPIIGGGLWMTRSSTTCENFLQTPLLVIGFVVLIVSLAGFIGACFHVAWALWVYLVVMLFLIATLMGLTVFGFVVTGPGGGVEVPGRVYKEYHLEKYSPWLTNRIKDPRYWNTIRSCIVGSKTCAKLALWTPLDYLEKDMTPIQVIFSVFMCFYFYFLFSSSSSSFLWGLMLWNGVSVFVFLFFFGCSIKKVKSRKEKKIFELCLYFSFMRNEIWIFTSITCKKKLTNYMCVYIDISSLYLEWQLIVVLLYIRGPNFLLFS